MKTLGLGALVTRAAAVLELPMDCLLSIWTYAAPCDTVQRKTVFSVLPDGCRDLICHQSAGAAPRWFISDLQDAPFAAVSATGDHTFGFRMRAGAQFDEGALLKAVAGFSPDEARVVDVLRDMARVSENTQEALGCLGAAPSTGAAARDLGVSLRTLQRLVARETGRDPGFWRQLARVRAAARGIDRASLSEAAYDAGFCDQAHMARAFQRWFGAPPRRFRNTPQLRAQLASSGYF